MIRISTTDIRVGDRIRTSCATEGIVTSWRGKGLSRFMVHMDTADSSVRIYCTSAGSVELLSDLGDREACKPFGRW